MTSKSVNSNSIEQSNEGSFLSEMLQYDTVEINVSSKADGMASLV